MLTRCGVVALAVGLVIAGLRLWHTPASSEGADAPTAAPRLRRPDAVFLIVVDTLRADRLSCYGYGAHATPNIDRLADAGTRFTRAQSVASWTRPSVAAIITSRYPTQLGVIERPAQPDQTFAWREVRKQHSGSVPEYARTLAELLSDAGFHTAAFVNQPALNCGRGYQRGFTDWYYALGPDEIRRRRPGQAGTQKWPSSRYADRCDRLLIREFARWLGENSARRPFAWVHLLTPHRPYTPAPEYAPPAVGGRDPSPSALYDGEVRAADDLVGMVVDAIEQNVGFERSLIVFTSDHGEEFGEHGMHEHGHSLHREVIHVPLIIVSPSLPAGQTVERCVRTIDILPTVLDTVGQSALAPADIEGVALRPLIATGGPPPARLLRGNALRQHRTLPDRGRIQGDV